MCAKIRSNVSIFGAKSVVSILLKFSAVPMGIMGKACMQIDRGAKLLLEAILLI